MYIIKLQRHLSTTEKPAAAGALNLLGDDTVSRFKLVDMKKVIIFILMIMMLVFCSCNTKEALKNTDDSTLENPQGNTDEIKPNTASSGNLEIVMPNVEIPLPTLETYEEYEDYINSVELPSNFVYYDSLKSIGDFDCLIIMSGFYGECTRYLYQLVDPYGFDLSLYIDSRAPADKPEIVKWETLTYVDNDDMRTLDRDAKWRGVYSVDGIKYRYLEECLYSIVWEHNGVEYSLCGSDFGLDGYHIRHKDTTVSKLLNTETVKETVDMICGIK